MGREKWEEERKNRDRKRKVGMKWKRRVREGR